MKILIIEDNRDIAANIADFLEPRGHILDFASDGLRGFQLALAQPFDAIVLDIMMPGMDGLRLCRELREQRPDSPPILMLTARDQLEDKLAGFSAGADDYLVKPFSVRELEVRLQALVKRVRQSGRRETLVVGDLEYSPDTLCAERAGQPLELNPTQRRLLELLMLNSHRVVTRDELEKHIWGDAVPDKDSLRSHIYSLRTVIDRPFSQSLLHTVHGSGYRLYMNQAHE